MARVRRIGVDEVIHDLEELGGARGIVEKVGGRALRVGGQAAVEIARATAPRRTGKFAESIHMEGGGDAGDGSLGGVEETGTAVAVVVGSALWRAHYVEFGTKRLAARRTVGNAVEMVDGVIVDALDHYMADYLGELGF